MCCYNCTYALLRISLATWHAHFHLNFLVSSWYRCSMIVASHQHETDVTEDVSCCVIAKKPSARLWNFRLFPSICHFHSSNVSSRRILRNVQWLLRGRAHLKIHSDSVNLGDVLWDVCHRRVWHCAGTWWLRRELEHELKLLSLWRRAGPISPVARWRDHSPDAVGAEYITL